MKNPTWDLCLKKHLMTKSMMNTFICFPLPLLKKFSINLAAAAPNTIIVFSINFFFFERAGVRGRREDMENLRQRLMVDLTYRY